MRSPKLFLLVLALTSLVFATGGRGGCGGGTTDPEIEVPTESPCPEEMPDPWSRCELDPAERCSYEKIICCNAEGGEGDSFFTTHAQCADGQWVIAMAMIACEHGYWPDNCSN